MTVRWASDPAVEVKESLLEEEHEAGSRVKPCGTWHVRVKRRDGRKVIAVMSWPLAHADLTRSSFWPCQSQCKGPAQGSLSQTISTYSVSTSVSLNVTVNGVSLAPYPGLQAFTRGTASARRESVLQDWQLRLVQVLRMMAFSPHLSLTSSSASPGNITILACFSITLSTCILPFLLPSSNESCALVTWSMHYHESLHFLSG